MFRKYSFKVPQIYSGTELNTSGGYPWTVIQVGKRDEYMKSLEIENVTGDISTFSKFLSYLVTENMKGKPVAHVPGNLGWYSPQKCGE